MKTDRTENGQAWSPRRLAGKLAVAALALAGIFTLSTLSAQDEPEDPFLRWMNQFAQHQLQERQRTIDAIHTIAQANARKKEVRAKMLEALGGLPDYKGPLDAQVTGQIRNDSYTIEKVLYESLPGLYVTANVYRPNRPGRYPAVLLQSGHTQEGKPEDQIIAANLVMKGFVVLTFDPLGQGEREQTYSRQQERPLAGWSTPEHALMDAQAMMIGQGLARYFIWDAMRSLDYLTSRLDVDASRLGAAGCSGGGALTVFTGGLDPRLKVVVPACYPASFQVLFPLGGPDSEMTFPHMLASGLDTADFVEFSAPTPWELQATEHDEYHFTPAGVRLVYEEARNWYALYGAQDKVGFFVGPGSHGMPLVSREEVYKWMIRYLENGQGDYHDHPVQKMYTSLDLQVTKTGHVEDLPGSRKIYQLLRDDYHAERRPKTLPELKAELENLKIPTDGLAPEVQVLDDENVPEGRREHIKFESEPGIWLDATLYIPPSPGRKPAVLVVKSADTGRHRPTVTRAEQIARAGQVVLEMAPRTSPPEIASEGEGVYPGDWRIAVWANLIGRNLPAMRAHDILRGVDLLAARSEVDPNSIHAEAQGVSGVWLLLAAAADPRIGKIWLDKTPHSLQVALDDSMSTDLWDGVIPGFMLHWDLSDLVKLMGNRQAMWTDPTDWMGRVVPLGPPFQYRYVLGDATDLKNAQDDAYIQELLR